MFQTSSTDDTAAIQFAIAYGNPDGDGGVLFDDTVSGLSPTTSIYGQYRTLVLEDENAKFVFGDDLQEVEMIYMLLVLKELDINKLYYLDL